jgi:ABC-2 type transport system permease protein
MSDVGLVLTQTRYGFKTLFRTPRVLVFSVLFPILLLVLFNSIFATGKNATVEFHGHQIDTATYFTAGIMAYAIMTSAFSTLAIAITARRERGELKRLRGTPVPPWTFMVSQVLRSVLTVALMVVGLLLIGRFAFDVSIPGKTLPGLVVYVVLGTAAFCTLGIALTALTPTEEVASTVAPFSAVILSFISGVFIPIASLPDWLQQIGRLFPLYHLADGLQNTFFPTTGGGIGLTGSNVASLAVWGLAGLVVAVRRFKWEPQGAGQG